MRHAAYLTLLALMLIPSPASPSAAGTLEGWFDQNTPGKPPQEMADLQAAAAARKNARAKNPSDVFLQVIKQPMYTSVNGPGHDIRVIMLRREDDSFWVTAELGQDAHWAMGAIFASAHHPELGGSIFASDAYITITPYQNPTDMEGAYGYFISGRYLERPDRPAALFQALLRSPSPQGRTFSLAQDGALLKLSIEREQATLTGSVDPEKFNGVKLGLIGICIGLIL